MSDRIVTWSFFRKIKLSAAPNDILFPPTASLIAAGMQACSSGAPASESLLTSDEVLCCENVMAACVSLQNQLNVHRERISIENKSANGLKLVQLYNKTLRHLDAAADCLFEIGFH